MRKRCKGVSANIVCRMDVHAGPWAGKPSEAAAQVCSALVVALAHAPASGAHSMGQGAYGARPDLELPSGQLHVGAGSTGSQVMHPPPYWDVSWDVCALARWLDIACAALGLPGGATALVDSSQPNQISGDGVLVVIGGLLGAGSTQLESWAAGVQVGVELTNALSSLPAALYLWPMQGCRMLGSPCALVSSLCTALDWVLCKAECQMFNAFGGQGSLGLSMLHHYVAKWLGFAGTGTAGPAGGLAWLGVLEGQQVLGGLALLLLSGADYLVYSVCAVSVEISAFFHVQSLTDVYHIQLTYMITLYCPTSLLSTVGSHWVHPAHYARSMLPNLSTSRSLHVFVLTTLFCGNVPGTKQHLCLLIMRRYPVVKVQHLPILCTFICLLRRC